MSFIPGPAHFTVVTLSIPALPLPSLSSRRPSPSMHRPHPSSLLLASSCPVRGSGLLEVLATLPFGCAAESPIGSFDHRPCFDLLPRLGGVVGIPFLVVEFLLVEVLALVDLFVDYDFIFFISFFLDSRYYNDVLTLTPMYLVF